MNRLELFERLPAGFATFGSANMTPLTVLVRPFLQRQCRSSSMSAAFDLSVSQQIEAARSHLPSGWTESSYRRCRFTYGMSVADQLVKSSAGTCRASCRRQAYHVEVDEDSLNTPASRGVRSHGDASLAVDRMWPRVLNTVRGFASSGESTEADAVRTEDALSQAIHWRERGSAQGASALRNFITGWYLSNAVSAPTPADQKFRLRPLISPTWAKPSQTCGSTSTSSSGVAPDVVTNWPSLAAAANLGQP